jgi:hypothetical protein
MNNSNSEYNSLSTIPKTQSKDCQNYLHRQCSGRGCTKDAKILLEILYINKRGYFCDECTSDLLSKGLAVRASE